MKDDKRRKSDEWDQREREWTKEMRKANPATRSQMKPRRKKFNPKNRFRLMLVCLGIFLFSAFVLWLTMFDPNASLQGIVSMFSTFISGIVFVMNYGKDIMVTVVNSITKNSLR